MTGTRIKWIAGGLGLGGLVVLGAWWMGWEAGSEGVERPEVRPWAARALEMPLLDVLIEMAEEDAPGVAAGEVREFFRVEGERLRKDVAGVQSAREVAEALSRVMFEQLGFQADTADPEGRDFRNSLVPWVVMERRGVCFGLALVGVLLAERAGIEAGVVSAPRHAWVRVRSRGETADLETSMEGFAGKVLPETFYQDAGRFPARYADPAFGRVLSQAQCLGLLLVNRASIHHDGGNLRLAWRDTERAYALWPDGHDVLVERCVLLSERRQPAETVRAAWEEAMGRHPKSAVLAYNRAVWEFDRGRRGEALRWARRAVELNPRYEMGRGFLASLEKEASPAPAVSREPVAPPPPFRVEFGAWDVGAEKLVQGAWRIEYGRPPGELRRAWAWTGSWCR